MRSSYLIPCLVLILLSIHSGLSRIKSRTSKTPNSNKKPNIPKTNTVKKPGQLFYRGKGLSLQFNVTDESLAYAANYTMFPDELHYPRPSTVPDYEEFLGTCTNTTLELELNKDKLSTLSSDVNTRVTLRIITFLCSEIYNRSAGLYPGGSWIGLTIIAMLIVIKMLD
ncbi:prion-like protein doppel [Hyla sarda]|uniref:prion-like protein doppel n=1 Tax=Hyla sarda TaxID=327740 RepID=UPI0024C26559|nr:prion-like protein doppel [Hyla sarda]